MPDAPKTVEDVIVAQVAAREALDADHRAAADLDAKTKSDTETFTATTAQVASGLKQVGDVYRPNGDGSVTAYFSSSTTADGFYTEVLKPSTTPIDAAPMPDQPVGPVVTPPDATPGPVDVSPTPDEPAPPADHETVVITQ